MRENRYWRLGLLVIAAGALLFWGRDLDQRPMHQDEAIGADKFHSLWKTYKYVYDPQEYHGPTLNYFTLPVVWGSGAKNYQETSEVTYRMVTVMFGVGCILLLGLVATGGKGNIEHSTSNIEHRRAESGLGWPEVLCAGVLMAISPAVGFYSRYYIHEILLVFFVFLAIACGWRYSQSGRKRWAYLCGAALGLAYATKETWVLSLGAMVIGLGVALLWSRAEVRGQKSEVRRLLSWRVWVGAGILGMVVAAVLFSGLFTNWRGPVDAVKTYFTTYVERGTAKGDHDKPFGYYIGLLSYYRYGRGTIHSEVLIFALAAVGVIRALWPARSDAPIGRVILLRFLAFYSVGLMLIYSAIPYKTPWCLLSFWHGMILLAGVGAVALVRLPPHVWMRYVVAGILMVPAGQLAYQAWRINFKYVADARFNPYLYSMPGQDFLRLVARVEDLAKVSPSRGKMFIRVVSSDCWPLPWYLRGYERVEYWDTSSGRDPYADVVIGAATDGDLEARLGRDFVVENYGLRRGVVLAVYVERKLWEEFKKKNGLN